MTYKNSIIIKQVSLGSYFKALESYHWNLVYSIWYFYLEYFHWTVSFYYNELRIQFSKRPLFFGYIDVGDWCWRRNRLVTIIRCGWRLWPQIAINTMSPTSPSPSFHDRMKICWIRIDQELKHVPCHRTDCTKQAQIPLQHSQILEKYQKQFVHVKVLNLMLLYCGMSMDPLPTSSF